MSVDILEDKLIELFKTDMLFVPKIFESAELIVQVFLGSSETLTFVPPSNVMLDELIVQVSVEVSETATFVPPTNVMLFCLFVI